MIFFFSEEYRTTSDYYSDLSGYRNNSDGSFNNQGTNSYYWSSSPNTTNGYNANFNAGGGNVANNNNRANGFSVRCLKN